MSTPTRVSTDIELSRLYGKIEELQQRLTAADEQIDLLTPRHTEQPEGKRERFEKWVMATKHPVYGFLDGRSLARGDDRAGYADGYVQGLWVAYLAFGAEQPAPVAVVLAVDPELERLMKIVQQYPNVDPLEYDAAVRTLRK